MLGAKRYETHTAPGKRWITDNNNGCNGDDNNDNNNNNNHNNDNNDDYNEDGKNMRYVWHHSY